MGTTVAPLSTDRLKVLTESLLLVSNGKLFHSLTADGRKELQYWEVRESIVWTFSALRKLYVEILLIEGGTREERYAGEILLNI